MEGKIMRYFFQLEMHPGTETTRPLTLFSVNSCQKSHTVNCPQACLDSGSVTVKLAMRNGFDAESRSYLLLPKQQMK